jgi:hypothetical protein
MGVAGELIWEVTLARHHGLYVSRVVATIHVCPPRAIGDQPPTDSTMPQAEGRGCSACGILPREPS